MINDELLNKFARIKDLPVPEEALGAYFEGNLNRLELIGIENIISESPIIGEMVKVLDAVDDEIYSYINDNFTYGADMTALDAREFNIPNIDDDSNSADQNVRIKDDFNHTGVIPSSYQEEHSFTLHDDGETEMGIESGNDIEMWPDNSEDIWGADNIPFDFTDSALDND